MLNIVFSFKLSNTSVKSFIISYTLNVNYFVRKTNPIICSKSITTNMHNMSIMYSFTSIQTWNHMDSPIHEYDSSYYVHVTICTAYVHKVFIRFHVFTSKNLRLTVLLRVIWDRKFQTTILILSLNLILVLVLCWKLFRRVIFGAKVFGVKAQYHSFIVFRYVTIMCVHRYTSIRSIR